MRGSRVRNKKKQQEEEIKLESEHGSSLTELSSLEIDCCKQNFIFYDKQKLGYVERFELPMLLSTCGYNLTDDRIKELNSFLDEKTAQRIDLPMMLATLTHLK